MYLEMDNHATKQFHHIYSKEKKGKRRIKKVMKLKDDNYKSNKTVTIDLL